VNFREKPKNIDNGTHIINTGFYIINADIVPEKSGDYKLEYDFFPQYVQKF
jgi:NDP-sugar pyrophosphorylase family protein